jgi:predicted transcriptional regulator
MNKTVLHMPEITMIHDGVILALWRERMDTLDIAKKLNLRESQVANRLARLREQCGK